MPALERSRLSRTELAQAARGLQPRTRHRHELCPAWSLLVALAWGLERATERPAAGSSNPLTMPVFPVLMRVLRVTGNRHLCLFLDSTGGKVAGPMDAEAVLRLTLRPPQGATWTPVPEAVPTPVREMPPWLAPSRPGRGRPHHPPRR